MGSSIFGIMVEKAIDEQYFMTHLADRIKFGQATKLGSSKEFGTAYYAKPDILNMTLKTYNEIKPFSATGIEAGIAQMKLRWEQLSPFGYIPDIVWAPPIQPFPVGVLLIYVQNFDGVLYYSEVDARVPRTIDVLPALVVAAEMNAQTQAAMSARAMSAFTASGANRTILNVLPKTAKMAADGKKADHERFKMTVALATFTIPIGCIGIGIGF
jgi:hypothetical protein